MDFATLRKQLETSKTARRHRTEWTEAEVLKLIDLADSVGLEAAAKQLGRTYFAVLTAHSLLNQGWVPAAAERKPAPAYRGWREGDGDE